MIQPASLLLSILLGGVAFFVFKSAASSGKGFGLMRVYILLSLVLIAAPFAWPLMGTGLQTVKEVLPQVQVLGGLQPVLDASPTSLPWKTFAYFMGVLVFLVIFLRSLFLGFRLFQGATREANSRIYWVSDDINPCSFAGRVFLSRNKPVQESVLRHEMVHATSYHFEEQVFTQLFSIVFWWNPFVHLLAQQQKLVHEWEADAVASQTERKSYAETMIRFAAQPSLGINFSSHKQQLKQRIMKLQSDTQSASKTKWSLAMIPLLAIASLWFSPAVQAQTEEKVKLADVDVYPTPDGCTETTKEGTMNCFLTFMATTIGSEIRYPKEAKEKKLEGRAFVRFVVGTNGKVQDVEIVRSTGGGNEDPETQQLYRDMDQEAVRVLQSMSFEEPAKKNGKPVAMEMVQPITFKLN